MTKVHRSAEHNRSVCKANAKTLPQMKLEKKLFSERQCFPIYLDFH